MKNDKFYCYTCLCLVTENHLKRNPNHAVDAKPQSYYEQIEEDSQSKETDDVNGYIFHHVLQSRVQVW